MPVRDLVKSLSGIFRNTQVGVEPATMAAATPMATQAPTAITARPSVDRSGSESESADIISTAAMSAVVISVEGTVEGTAAAMVAGITDPGYRHQGCSGDEHC